MRRILGSRWPYILFFLVGGCSGPQTVDDSAASGAAQPPEQVKPLPEVKWTGKTAAVDERWKEWEKLVSEQKYEQASKLVQEMIKKNSSKQRSEEWVRGLIRYIQLRIALHGYETSVRFLSEQTWPKDLLATTVLQLYYANLLTTYAGAYSWEIRKRERVESKGVVDLKAWTLDQIYAEAQRACHEVYMHRQQLGKYPVKHLEEHIEPNTYPRHIRPTLRDTVSYMWVELLANTSSWRPEHSNEIYQLDLEHLLGDRKPPAVSLTDPAAHPLSKIAAILEDLESWHAGRKEPEAALEARLNRLRILHTSFTQEADRTRIKKDLQQHLSAMRQHRWWSMGMSLLAELVREEDAPDNLIRARKIARQGQQAYPRSVGGRRCQHIIESIERPDYNLEAMAADAPGRASMGVMHKNLSKMYFRAYSVDLKAHIESAKDYSLFPTGRELERLVSSRKPSHRWEIDLPKTPDFKLHRTLVSPPMRAPGFYVVVSSAQRSFGRSRNVLKATFVVVGDLVLVTRQERGEVQVDVLSGASGAPVEGVSVFLYRFDYRNGHRVVDSRVTPQSGSVSFRRADSQSHFLFAQKGRQIAIDPSYLYLYRHRDPGRSYSTLFYTDRSIYRPNQTLHYKAVVFRHDRGGHQVAPRTRLTISLRDANYQEVAKQTLATNSYGTASGTFVIPAGRLLGRWQLRSSRSGSSVVSVEEYKRPTFEAKIKDPPAPLRLNKKATLQGEARYYFGLPVTSGKVTWRVTRSPVYPWWWGYYSWYFGGSGGSRTQTIDAGVARLKEDGTFNITFVPAADERLAAESKDLTYRYSLTADVTDEGGETRSASRSFRLGFVAVEARMSMEENFLREGKPAKLTVVRSNLDGVPEAGKGSYRIVALRAPARTRLPADQPLPRPPGKKKQDEAYRTQGDLRRTRWNPGYQPRAVLREWPDGQERARGKLEHNAKGEAAVKLPALSAGPYRLRYTTKDAFGATYEMSQEFMVGGKRVALKLPAYLEVERGSVKVGQTARIFVTSGLDDQPIYIDLYRDGARTERRRLRSGKDATLIEIPVTEAQRGGFSLTVSVLRDHQFMHFNRSIFVPWDNKELRVSFSTFRDKLRPGAQERWTIKVSGPAGAKTPVRAAEVLAYMYDRSLDAFVSHSPPSPISIFPNRARAVLARASLGQARQGHLRCDGFGSLPHYPHLRTDQLRFYSGYGIGGPGRRGDIGGFLGTTLAAPPPSSPRRKRAAVTEAPAGAKLELAKVAQDAPADEERRSEAQDSLADAAGGEPAPRVQVRADFSETAFFKPHLLTGEDGSVSFEFTVPDSVTSWNLWAHAITRDLQSGSVKEETRTVKDLMVRPYLPRFLREGDRATLKVVVNNASDRQLKGKLSFDIIDPETEKSLLSQFGLSRAKAVNQAFSVKAGGGTNLTFAVKAPPRVGLVAFKVIASSGQLSDGELRPIPLLPGRMHLIQSRFVTLKDRASRTMRFADMAAGGDPTLIHDQLVVTIDAQLFYSVLSALPYLVNYPFECTEQTLNRFVSTGILASMYKDYPAIERMAKTFAARKTQYERWDKDDPNRKMALVETPWLRMARGGPEREHPLINVLDPRITRAQRDASLAKLRKAQTSLGGFPWFPGGPPSPYMTLYILYGFSKALEFGVDVPRDLIQRAWRYMHRHYVDELVDDMIRHDCCWELITFLNYVLSNYPDTSWTGGVFSELERKKMLDHSFRHWKQHSPYLKGYLALTLKRMGRNRDAVLVWQSVMDSAKTEKDQGTHWAPEDRGWLWYNDTIETHAFAIRTVMELMPKDSRLEGLVLWIFLNKKLNHWKSTRATAEVVYSLAHYLKKTAQLALKEQIDVTAGDLKRTFVFLPDTYTGKKNQIVIGGAQIDAKRHSTITVAKETRGFALASATWHFSTDRLPKEARGDYLAVKRSYFKRVKSGQEVKLQPLDEGARIEVGDEVEVQLSLRTKHPMEYVHLRDPRPAGFEPVDLTSRHKWNLGIYWYEEIRDSGTNFFFERLPQGEYPFKYRLRAAIAGTFKAAPATVQPMYAPEFAGYSSGRSISVRAAN